MYQERNGRCSLLTCLSISLYLDLFGKGKII